MKASFIIPCRDRQNNLALCLRSIQDSAAKCGITDWQIIIVDDTSDSVYEVDGFSLKMTTHKYGGRVVTYYIKGEKYFNKPALLNIGIGKAQGDILTFLDADALVGPLFMENVQRLVDDPTLTKLCYRVRKTTYKEALHYPQCFDDYDNHRIAFEAYGLPDRSSWRKPCQPVFGNSQFSIRRDVLGDLRYDERFGGRGYEDIHFNFLIWKRYYDTYKAEIVTDAQHAMYHIENPPSSQEHWGPAELNTKNCRLYKNEFSRWKQEMRIKGVNVCNAING